MHRFAAAFCQQLQQGFGVTIPQFGEGFFAFLRPGAGIPLLPYPTTFTQIIMRAVTAQDMIQRQISGVTLIGMARRHLTGFGPGFAPVIAINRALTSCLGVLVAHSQQHPQCHLDIAVIRDFAQTPQCAPGTPAQIIAGTVGIGQPGIGFADFFTQLDVLRAAARHLYIITAPGRAMKQRRFGFEAPGQQTEHGAVLTPFGHFENMPDTLKIVRLERHGAQFLQQYRAGNRIMFGQQIKLLQHHKTGRIGMR